MWEYCICRNRAGRVDIRKLEVNMSFDSLDFVPVHDAAVGVLVTPGSVLPVVRVDGTMRVLDVHRGTFGERALDSNAGTFLGVRDRAQLQRVCEQDRRWFDAQVAKLGGERV